MHKLLAPLSVALIMIASCSNELESSQVPVAESEQRAEAAALIPGSVIVQFDEAVADSLANAPEPGLKTLKGSLDNLGIVAMERLYPDAGEWEPRHRKAGLHRWYKITYDPAARPATKAADDLSSLPGVVYAEPERKIQSTSYFNDPYAIQQWSLYNDGSKGQYYTAGCDINVEPVWDIYTGGTPNVIVAVIDGGVQQDHPDLEAVCIPGGPDGSKCFVYGYEGYTIPADNHGTHVAGIIGAVNNNGIGICGIAGGRDGNGGVRIMSCPFLMASPTNPDETYQGSSYNALIWAADHGAVIAQNSWSYVYENEDQAKNGGVGSMKTAIDYFIEYAGCDKTTGEQLPDSPMKGGVVLFAAGNEGWSIGWPAAYEPVVAVGAISANYIRAYYSNYGDWIDICAPGGDAKKNVRIYSTVASGKYANYQGTSMACPHASGVAALLASYYGGPGFTNDMLKEKLIGGAAHGKVPQDTPIGPMLDALGAFTYGGTTPPLVPDDIELETESNNINVSWKVTADPDDVRTYGYIVLMSDNAANLSGINPASIPESLTSVDLKVGHIQVGETISTQMSDLEFETPYYFSIIAYDYLGHYSEQSAIKSITTMKNDAPVISTEYTGAYTLEPFEKISVDYTVSDPNGHAFKVEVDPGSDAFTWVLNAGLVQATISGNGAAHGQYTAHIVATDAYGAATDYPIHYEILENHAPVVIGTIDNIQFSKSGQRTVIDMAKYVKDDDAEQLTYSAKLSDKNVAKISQLENTLIVTSSGFGLTDVTVTATDACGEKCNLSFKILVRDNDTAGPVDLYPNPVVDVLNIRPVTEGQLEINIYNKAGAAVKSQTSAASIFEPVVIDLSDLPGGIYYVKVKGAGIDNTYTIAKR